MLDLMPRDQWSPGNRGWQDRQTLMEGEYRELIADPAHTELAYQNDFGAFRDWLGRCSGRVLDLGGGNGLLRHFLPPGVDYVVVDPSTTWFDADWRAAATAFPCLAEPLAFVAGVAEHLPLRSGAFDWVVSFWSLNHVSDPARALSEIRRVLGSGGRALLVLEEMPPTAADLVHGVYRDHRWGAARTWARWLLRPVWPWPLQPDHIRLSEASLEAAWRGRFTLETRAWKGSYLALELAAADAVVEYSS